jgi:hypothetical protein
MMGATWSASFEECASFVFGQQHFQRWLGLPLPQVLQLVIAIHATSATASRYPQPTSLAVKQ